MSGDIFEKDGRRYRLVGEPGPELLTMRDGPGIRVIPPAASDRNTQGSGSGAGTGSGNGSGSGSGSTNTGGGAGTGPKAVELAYTSDGSRRPVPAGSESVENQERSERKWQRLRKLAAAGRLKAGQPY